MMCFVTTVTLLGSTGCVPRAEDEPEGDTSTDAAADEGPADRNAEATDEGGEGGRAPVAVDIASVQAELGACRDLGPAHEVQREGVSIGKAVRERTVWFRIPAGSELDVQPSEYRHDTPDPPEMVRIPLDEEHALGAFVSDEVLVRRWMTDRIEEATTGELPDLSIGAVVDETDGAVTSGLLALADGRVAFVGDCFDEWMSEPLAVYAEELDRSAQDVLDGFVADEDEGPVDELHQVMGTTSGAP